MSIEAVDVSYGGAVSSPLRGDNGDIVEGTTGSDILDLFDKLVRGADEIDLRDKINRIVSKKNFEETVDLFILAFQTRDCRGGKGERQLFTIMFDCLHESYHQTCLKLLPFIPMFGYVKDLVVLLENSTQDGYPDASDIQSHIIDLFVKQLVDDYEKYQSDKENAKISLTAKWVPKEGCSFAKKHKDLFSRLAEEVLKETKKRKLRMSGGSMKVYRTVVSSLNKHLDTLEIKMCSSKFSEIDFSKVPSVALNKWRKALLNEKIGALLLKEDFETGNRYPDRPDRVEARKTLRATSRDCKVKGSQVFPHTIIETIKGHPGESETEILESQWKDIVSKSHSGKGRKVIPMADVSGSMIHGSGNVIPMDVSIALSLLLSEVTHEAFRNRILTFDTSPKWLDMSDCDGLKAKIDKLDANNTNSGSTNIEAALRLILQVAVSKSLKSEDIPDLCIFSDMQFDQASGKRDESVYNVMKAEFNDVGLEIPRVIFWNLSSNTVGHTTSSDSLNTVILSGFSQSLFKYILDGTEIDDVTPYGILRNILDSDRYKCIKDFLLSDDPSSLVDKVCITEKSD